MKSLIYGMFVMLFISIPILQQGIYYSETLELIIFITAAICVFMLFSCKRENYSLYKLVAMFIIFFFCISPIIQYKSGVSFFGSKFTESQYVMTSLCLLCVLLLYVASYNIFKKYIKSNKQNIITAIRLTKHKEYILILISVLICIYYLYLNKFNLMSLFYRGGELVERVQRNQSIGQIIETFVRPMPVIIFLSVYLSEERRRSTLYILAILMLIAAAPTGMPRFSAAAMYLPVLLCIIPRLRRGYNFILLVIGGILVVFPFLDNFRYLAEGNAIKIGLDFEMFKSMHFDSYSMCMRAISEGFITYGRQLLGVIFFFVPRSLWPNKPAGSGHTMFESMNMDFTNVSMPYFAEGYINFGIIGIIIFTLFLAYITAVIDKKYWSTQTSNDTLTIDSVMYIMMIGLLMMVLRGDLMSSFSFSCGFILSFKAIRWYITR